MNARGFTLIEVMIAMAIIGLTAVVLLEQRTEIVRDAARARNSRTAWVLASQKIAQLELDPTLWLGENRQSNGDFRDLDAAYETFTWEYQILRHPIEVVDPLEAKKDEKVRELLRLTLVVRSPGGDDPVVLEAQFPIAEPKKAEAPVTATPPGGTPQTPTPPPGGGAPK